MPIEVGSFSTEVTMLDRELPLSPKQIEAIVQEVARRIQKATQDEERRSQSASFGNSSR